MTRLIITLAIAFSSFTGFVIAEDLPADLKKVKFTAVFSTSGGREFSTARSVGDFTIVGPNRESLKGLPDRTSRVTFDPKDKLYYSIGSHSVFKLNSEASNPQELKLGFTGEQALSWPCGITFDTKRNRLLVVSLGGVGYWYSYTPADGKWSVLRDANNIDFLGIGYSSDTDVVHGLFQDFGDRQSATLCQINGSGTITKTSMLRHPQLTAAVDRSRGGSIVQLIPLRDHVIVITSPEHARDASSKSQMFVVNLKTLEISETWSE